MNTRKLLYGCAGLVLALSLFGAACGQKQPAETQAVPAETQAPGPTAEVVVPGQPDNMKAESDGEALVLSWKGVSDAEGYQLYAGSSRLSNDFVPVSEELIYETTYTVADPGNRYYRVTAVNGSAESEPSTAVAAEMVLFGENTYIYSPLDDPAAVNQEMFLMFNRQETAQFNKRRYAVLFKPGECSADIEIKMGFYKDVMGLGKVPTETTIQNFNCPATWLGGNDNHNATCNFWRGVSNLQVNSKVMWAVSQATFMRRMQINGSLALHDNYGWSSGGFLSDSVIDGIVDSGSQQQWLSRNCNWNMWSGENWNMVFVGIEDGKAPKGTWPAHVYTTVDSTPVVQEKPYLIYEDGAYSVFVPERRYDAQGVSWLDGAKGETISLDQFYVANAKNDTAATMNAALVEGKHLLLTPGIYNLDEALVVNNPNTIVLGMGYATLCPKNGNMCMQVADTEGIKIGGILFDAGSEESVTLLQVGEEKNDADHSGDPILLSDVFFRVGGAAQGNTAVQSCVIINSNDVVGDNFWVWRADHGDGVGWRRNTAPNGIIVNGDDVTIYALMVEHFQEYQTVWNGENGSVYFYQSELPYDVPIQSEWQSHDGERNGFASYYVADGVSTHTAYGIGIYSYNRDAVVEEYCAMEVPEADGMNLHNVCSVMITGNPGVTHVINDYGPAAYTGGARSIVKDFQEERAKAAEAEPAA